MAIRLSEAQEDSKEKNLFIMHLKQTQTKLISQQTLKQQEQQIVLNLHEEIDKLAAQNHHLLQ